MQLPFTGDATEIVASPDGKRLVVLSRGKTTAAAGDAVDVVSIAERKLAGTLLVNLPPDGHTTLDLD